MQTRRTHLSTTDGVANWEWLSGSDAMGSKVSTCNSETVKEATQTFLGQCLGFGRLTRDLYVDGE